MPRDIVAVKALPNHRLHLIFDNGVEGEVALNQLVPFKGVLEPLSNPDVFIAVSVNAELGTIQWPHGADLDPDVLYAEVQRASSQPHNKRT